jgi:DNA mismatch repair ATPase MutL
MNDIIKKKLINKAQQSSPTAYLLVTIEKEMCDVQIEGDKGSVALMKLILDANLFALVQADMKQK